VKHFPADRATKLAIEMSEGRWTHDFPISVQLARQMGLNVKTDMPLMVYQLMDLYPQANTMRPSVVYVPTRNAPERSPKGQTPAPVVPTK
jgi:hypothetical protein